VIFQRDKHDTSSIEGRTMLAHELTDVVQQRNGPVDGTPAGGGIQVSDPSDRFEREAAANAERAMSVPAPTAVSPAGPAVQRQADEQEQPEEAPVQGAFLQRQEGEEEQEEAPA
jgi:hypothetical protein